MGFLLAYGKQKKLVISKIKTEKSLNRTMKTPIWWNQPVSVVKG